ncbi:hypothetical protein P691DRAFT_803197 [Macrolepiota fuliginosa MF-IS2]|uniref:Uncharacterized protein n=1 Tax=Macrolepiota fuliginosa MF-IS2 TaxID=1400762 RepID=A0A9P5XA91_9AGAR|nr:hypothetical protein P691DRAFT_803197 [Macrolepiota fuliginosa MF-IS2]
MLPHPSLRYALAGCLLQATVTSARVGIKIPIIIDATTTDTVTFSFLIIFSVFMGILFLVAMGKAFGLKDELPPDVSPTKYTTGVLYNWLAFLAVSLWWAQLIIYTVYVRDVYLRKPRRGFPDSAYIARYALDELTDFFIAAAALQLVHYRLKIHASVTTPFSLFKKAFDVGILLALLGVIGYTTAFLTLSAADPKSESKYLQWLTSYYVYTGVHVLVVINVIITILASRKTLKGDFIVDEPVKYLSAIPGTLFVHALFRIIVAILYSQYRNPKIDYDALRVFEVIVFGLTNLIATGGLSFSGSKNDEDEKKMKALKELEKQGKLEAAAHNHTK